MESGVLNLLHFRLSVPTTKTFLRYYIVLSPLFDTISSHISIKSDLGISNLQEIHTISSCFLQGTLYVVIISLYFFYGHKILSTTRTNIAF